MITRSNYHRYIYAVLAAVLAVLGLIQTGAIPLLAALPTSWTWAPLVLLLAIAFLKDFLPRIQSPAPPTEPIDPPIQRDPILTVIPFPTPSTNASASPTSLSAVPPPTPPGESHAIPR